jgi:stage V sporulation protein D (sporulation-specific penicillin-binding protein)
MDKYVTCSGQLPVGNHIIHCAPDPPYNGVHGRENLRGILKNSCNIGMAMFGMALGSHKLYDMEQKYGFLQYPNSGLPGEQRCWVQSPAKFNRFTGHVGWSQIQLANIAFGQGISVTPLQLTTAYCAIANGGTLVQPHIVHAIQKGQVITDIPVVTRGQILRPEVANMVKSCLGTVVTDGTGKPAQIAGFDVGGKTGSAQVAGPHGYEAGQYVGSFIGMVPLSKPRLVILCAVFKPQGVHWGAVVAAPVVHDLAKVAMLQMHVTPDDINAPDANNRKTAKKPADGVQQITTTTGQVTQL